MKKGLLGLSAFIFAAALVGCSADKDKTDDKDGKSAKTEATTVGDTTAEKETGSETDKGSDPADSLSLKELAGPYHKTGHMAMGDYPDELSPDNIEEALKSDPMTISEDGTLHFCGKDYKLIAEGMDGEDTVFSVEGSGFDMDKYKKSSFSCSDKDYEGPCMFLCTVQHMTVNDEDYPYTQYNVYLTSKGDESYFGYISVDQGEADEDDDWSFDDWDWDDEETDEQA